MIKHFSLGKGLQSLIPAKKTQNELIPSDRESIFYVEVNKIAPNPKQPRKDFDNEGIKELAQSIKKYGVLQPLLVSKVEKEKERGLDVEYQLIAGERRWRAASLLGLPQVPVIIKDMPDTVAPRAILEIALIENIQRKNLNPIESAKAFNRLREEFKLTYAEIAEKVGKSGVAVTNTVRLLGLPIEMQVAIQNGKISEGHGRALLGISNSQKQKEVFKAILTNGLTVRDVENVASESIRKSKEVRKVTSSPTRFSELEQNLSGNLGVPVIIRSEEKGMGKILIRFANHEELNSVAKKILD